MCHEDVLIIDQLAPNCNRDFLTVYTHEQHKK
jgi:hypothetical protein